MPTNTVHNLSDDKKRRIFDAALQEFSVRTFSQASINHIVKSAGIPKGSFYQYFDGKEDLYLYVRDVASREAIDVLKRVREIDPQADVFDVIIRTTEDFLEQGEARQEYIEATMLAQLDNSDFIMKQRGSSTQTFIELVERDKKRGLIKPEVDSEIVVRMLSSFSLNEYFKNSRDKQRYLDRLRAAIQIIKAGVAVTIVD